MTTRTAIGFLIAPLIVALAIVLSSVRGDPPLEWIIALLIWYLGAGAIAAAIGVPAFVLLNRFGLVNLWSAVAIGLLCGFVGALIVGPSVTGPMNGYVPLTISGGIAGLVFGLVFVTSNNSLQRR